MNGYIFGNLMDWGNVLEKLGNLVKTGELDNHQDELLRLLRFEGNWRLREAAVEAASGLRNPEMAMVNQLVELIKREDLYLNLRIMATDALSILIPVIMESRNLDRKAVRSFINETNLEVTNLLSSPAPPIFHDALDTTFVRIKKAVETA